MSEGIFREKIHLNVARIKREGTIFEISVDPEKALAFKEGKIADVSDALLVAGIFFECKRGLHASEERMKAIFGTIDPYEIAAIIIKEGEVQNTADYRAAKRNEKREKIIGMIHANSIDPRTNAPHTPARIEAAMEEAKVRVDENKSAEEQLNGIVQKLRPILPIKFEMKELEIHLLPEHSNKIYGNLRKHGKILNENWNADGSWTGVIEIPGGLYDDFSEMLNALTQGRVEIKVLKVR